MTEVISLLFVKNAMQGFMHRVETVGTTINPVGAVIILKAKGPVERAWGHTCKKGDFKRVIKNRHISVTDFSAY